VLDGSGVIYGTTWLGGYGPRDGFCPFNGCGTVFQLAPPAESGGVWQEKILHRFGGNDGAYPLSGLTFDAAGLLYGTTAYGGSGQEPGVAFRLSPGKSGRWVETVRYSFQTAADGAYPAARPIFDSIGNLYGTTEGDGGISSWGTVFKLTPPIAGSASWRFTVLHSFAGPPDGDTPDSPLTLWNGALFSTTPYGGNVCRACGTVFEVWPLQDDGTNSSFSQSPVKETR
jgi:hypothetical protein